MRNTDSEASSPFGAQVSVRASSSRSPMPKKKSLMLKKEEPHVVIIGAGFGGLAVARGLKDVPVRVSLIDKSNHHLFQPLLYQVATAALAAPDIAVPIRKLL